MVAEENEPINNKDLGQQNSPGLVPSKLERSGEFILEGGHY